MREVHAVFINGVWLTVGGNVPWQTFPTRKFIKSIKTTENDPRNFMGSDADYIFITFEDGYVLEIKTSDYMVVYKSN